MFQPFSPALRDCLSQLAEAARRIGQYAGNLTETAFLNNCLVQDAVGRNLKIISESAQMIEEHCPDFRATHGENLCMSVASPLLPTGTSNSLNEVFLVRNALVHNGGRVSGQLANAFPHHFEKNAPLAINAEMLNRYIQSINSLTTLVFEFNWGSEL